MFHWVTNFFIAISLAYSAFLGAFHTQQIATSSPADNATTSGSAAIQSDSKASESVPSQAAMQQPPLTSTQNTQPSTPGQTVNIPVVVINTSPSATPNAATPTESGPVTITLKPDTLGIVSSGLDAFYNISSDSNSEVDIKSIQVSISGVLLSPGAVLSINDDTNDELAVASSQGLMYDTNSQTLRINETFNKPIKISSGYPTMFDIKITNVSALKNNPTITINSVGSGFIFNQNNSAVLQTTLKADAEAYYILNHSCVGLQIADEYSDCLSYALNY